MAVIVTRAGKGSPLTNNEVDSNFVNLNTAKIELTGAPANGNVPAWNAGTSTWVPTAVTDPTDAAIAMAIALG